MASLFSEKLRSARIMNGMSLQDLADKLENRITRQALHKYEKGAAMPDNQMITLLSEVLNVRPDYFFSETKVELGEVNFQKLVKFPAKERNKIIEKTRETLSRYLELEEIMGLDNQFAHHLKNYPINLFEDVENATIKLRKDWKLGNNAIYNVVELLEDKHIKVIELEEMDGFDGLQTWINGQKYPVIVLNASKDIPADRKRFTAFHELGHLLLNFRTGNEKLIEKYCHYFAGAMLFPKEIAFEELGEKRNRLNINELIAIKLQYGISIQALLYRLKNLEIITDNYYQQFMFFVRQMNWNKVEPGEYKGEEKSRRFLQLLFRALSEEIISMSKAAALNNQKLAEFRSKQLVIE
jgi:Zn-dependent peptidase ImmA (M78 family)/DNA-binding XRE family transcriptional regulator